jgi:hypothetical protein
MPFARALAARLRQSVAGGRFVNVLVFLHLLDNYPPNVPSKLLIVLERRVVMNLEIVSITGGLVVMLKSIPALLDKPQGRRDVFRSIVAVSEFARAAFFAISNFSQFPNAREAFF